MTEKIKDIIAASIAVKQQVLQDDTMIKRLRIALQHLLQLLKAAIKYCSVVMVAVLPMHSI